MFIPNQFTYFKVNSIIQILNYRKEILRSDMQISFLLLLIISYVVASKYAIDSESVNLYLIPYCMLPLIIRTFFDVRVALFTYLVAILIVGFIAADPRHDHVRHQCVACFDAVQFVELNLVKPDCISKFVHALIHGRMQFRHAKPAISAADRVVRIHA